MVSIITMTKKTLQEEIFILKEKLGKEEEINKLLKQEIELLYFELGKATRNLGIEKIFSENASKNYAAAAVSLIVDPNPVTLNCSGEMTGISVNYSIPVLDILAIHNVGRRKDIYLSKPHSPVTGGKKKFKLHFEKNQVKFEKLLHLIQGGGEHLLRVHNSYAINIYHYTFYQKNTFCLVNSMKNELNNEIHEIPIDSKFDKSIYQKRLFEIDRLNHQPHVINLNFEKIDELIELKKVLGLK